MKEIKDLVAELKKIDDQFSGDEEVAHIKADGALLEYIGSPEAEEAFNQIRKWYA